MLWSDREVIFVLYNSGSWAQYTDTYLEPQYGGEFTPPS